MPRLTPEERVPEWARTVLAQLGDWAREAAEDADQRERHMQRVAAESVSGCITALLSADDGYRVCAAGRIVAAGTTAHPTPRRGARGVSEFMSGGWLDHPPANQCDGCKRKLPLRDGMHYNRTYPKVAVMVCTRDRYQRKEREE